MRRRSLFIQSSHRFEPLNIFQSFTDLISNAFMILSMLLLLAFFRSLDLNQRLEAAAPIIIDERSGNFKFTSGSADLNSDLRDYIATEIVPQIKQITQERDIDFIQVIGHTDGQENRSRSNLDRTLEKVANNKQPVTQLRPGSNADLGLMRALAVVNEIQQVGGFEDVEFRAYSAAQLYLSSGELAPIPSNRYPDQTRRRIEIRFTPPGKVSRIITDEH